MCGNVKLGKQEQRIDVEFVRALKIREIKRFERSSFIFRLSYGIVRAMKALSV